MEIKKVKILKFQLTKKMLLKNPVCSNCKQPVLSEDMVKLPFMNDLTEFFIHNVEIMRLGNGLLYNNITKKKL